MRLHELEHVLRAAKGATGETEFVIIGSQAVLAGFPDAPLSITYSDELDIYPLNAPEKSDLIDGAIGELSQFHDPFGYYAHGVGPETATLPLRWRERAVRFESEHTRGAVAHCLHPLDIRYSKLAAGREKDTAYVGELLRCGLINSTGIESLIANETNDQNLRILLNERLEIALAKSRPPSAPSQGDARLN
jgi:hypothetical protein